MPLPRLLPALLFAGLLASAAAAAPATYVLEPDESDVTFVTMFGPDRITGHFPVASADLTLDFDAPANSKVAVTLDVSKAEASFPFASQAMRGPKVLDAEAHPTIAFVSRKVRPQGGTAAKIEGDITIRGATKPITLDAQIYRQQGTAEGDLSQLTIRLTGRINRSDFGATGWSDMVADAVDLDILARVERTGGP